MPLTKLIDSLNGVCRHCGQKAGILLKIISQRRLPRLDQFAG